MTPRLLLLLLAVHAAAAAGGGTFPRVIETPPRIENGLACYEAFLWHKFESRSMPTVAGARALCDDYARNAAAIGRHRSWTMMRLKDVGRFFGAVRNQYDKTPLAKGFSFFAETGKFCFSVNFKAYQLSAKGDFGYSNMELKFRSSYGVECPVNEPEVSVTHLACTAANCSRLPTPAPTLGPSVSPPDPRGPDRSRSRPCLLLGEDAVSMTDFREARLTYIIALVGCNLLSFAFLAAAIHYCLKWRHLRRLYRLARGPSSLAGGTASPPAVRHLGSSSANGSGAIGSVSLPPYGGAFPDYHYSSIARRKAMHHQQQQPRPDDDLLSYRSDHTQLLKGSLGGTLQRHAAPPSTLRHGAISPPRGWGNSEPPSTPGSMRRNGSISQMSMTSQGMPRRNGSLPAPPHPPPPPPLNGY